MINDENLVHATRSSSRKRPPAAHPHQHPSKRVALGELTNSLNVPAAEWTRNSGCQANDSKCQVEESDSFMAESTQDDSYTGTQEEKEKNPSNAELNILSTQISELAGCSHSSSMYQHLRSLEIEEKRRCSPNYMNSVQRDISVHMREILVDWLVEVTEEYRFCPDTLYLSVSYLDRFLSSQAWSRNKLQLLGVTCLLIASKYEEISPLRVEDCCYITDNTYTMEEIMDMEKDVLKFLNYEISAPTTKTFLRQVCKRRQIFRKAAHKNCTVWQPIYAATPFLMFVSISFFSFHPISTDPELHLLPFQSHDWRIESLSCFLAEQGLLDYGCLRFLPSVIAASAIFLSRLTIQTDKHPWSVALQSCSGYRPSDLKECVLALHDLQLNRKESSLQAVREKYSQQKFENVATLTPPSEVPAALLLDYCDR
ncbi:hypothetical protein Tsubulata_013173 [Turnera subulata]|uniref:B-like cyclin n=1 Tax=Turnera subulata TaxID=218843 RepID=A0A9Q0JDF0_9ROSI|nr:hypothetical protein Tsubulata_013173 [Turnera subulata]